MSKINKKELGDIGEKLSERYLIKCGYSVIDKNFRAREGEIDIVSVEKNEYVFVEVKTRSNLCFGKPREAVDNQKKKHLYKAAKYYLYKNNLEKQEIRFDVIEIYIEKNRYKLIHLKNVDINCWFNGKIIVKYCAEVRKWVY